MIELKNTCIGLRCHACNKNIIEYINKFQFSSGTEIICPHCGVPVLSIKKRVADNFQLNCFGCGETHTYTVSSKNFFSEKVASYGCKINKVDVIFTGSYEEVDIALYHLSEEINKLTDNYYSNLEQLYGRLHTAAIRILEKKQQENRIVCLCGSQDITIKLSDKGIRLICPHCGADEFIPLTCDSDLSALDERLCILIK